MSVGPRNAAASSIRRARRFLTLAKENLPDSRVKNDLRRMAIVMSVAALDTYMQTAILGSVGGYGTPISRSLGRMDVPLEELVSLADASVVARRADKDARPRVQVKNAVHRQLLKKTFHSSIQIGDGLAAAGVSGAWKKIADAMGEPAPDLKKRLDRIVMRRNQIVHEGDIRRLVRPRKVSFNDVTQQSAKADVDWMEQLLDAIDGLFT
jgi:hypothetical protein